MGSDLYLNDEQYEELLLKIHVAVHSPEFKIQSEDSNYIGDKYTDTNCGMCCEDFTTIDTAMFPDQFPERTSMKYALGNHVCPFDLRKHGEAGGSGCFYKCAIFKGIRTGRGKKRRRTWLDEEAVIKMVDKFISDRNDRNDQKQ